MHFSPRNATPPGLFGRSNANSSASAALMRPPKREEQVNSILGVLSVTRKRPQRFFVVSYSELPERFFIVSTIHKETLYHSFKRLFFIVSKPKT